MTTPLFQSILEDLQYCWTHVVLCIQPGERVIRVEGSLPKEAAIVVKLHAKQRVRERREVIIVDAGIHESCWKANLSLSGSRFDKR